MSSQRRSGRRRIAIVSGVTLAFSAALGGWLAAPAFAYKGTLTGTPCSTTAKACIDLDDQRAWLARDGKVVGGGFKISSGGYGKETPLGTFRVYSKDQDHKSREFPLPNGQPAPMPNSVFFAPGGIALHGGNPSRASAGCIHVGRGTDLRVFNFLNVGDEVQVVKSLDKVKGGFYKVNKLKTPNAKQQEENKKRLAAARQRAAGGAPAADDKKKSEHKKSDEKKDDKKKSDKKDDKKD